MIRSFPVLVDLAAGRPISGELDSSTVTAALEHRLGGLLWAQVRAGAVDVLADDARRLAVRQLQTAAHHGQLWGAIESLTDALANVGVQTAVLKGVAAETRWYDHLGERPCSDIDVLLEPRALSNLSTVLGVVAPASDSVDAIVRLVDRRKLQHIDAIWGSVMLDLHFDPLKVGIWTRAAQLFWDSTETVSSPSGHEVRMLGPEASLLGFLTHLNKDRFAYLGAFVDVARVLQRHDVDWDLLDGLIEAEGLQVPAWKSLGVVVDTLGLDIDVPRVHGLRARAWDLLWPESDRLRGHVGRRSKPRRQTMICLLAEGRRAEGLGEVRRQLVPPPDLLDLHHRSADGRSYLRRITVDRARSARRLRDEPAPVEPPEPVPFIHASRPR